MVTQFCPRSELGHVSLYSKCFVRKFGTECKVRFAEIVTRINEFILNGFRIKISKISISSSFMNVKLAN